MATLKQRLHRKNLNGYDIIHIETDATVVQMSPDDTTSVSTKIENIDTEMNSVKTSVSNGKSLIASAITDKGVSTASDATFQTMATNIGKLNTVVTAVPVKGEDFTYTGNCEVINDSDESTPLWRIKFLTSGIFTLLSGTMQVDAFYVGGGGGGSRGAAGYGGGGGYTLTKEKVVLSKNTGYPIVIGDGGTGPATSSTNSDTKVAGNNGGSTTAFGYSCLGGYGGYFTDTANGGDGGSGGGGWYSNGGSDGADGNSRLTSNGSVNSAGGKGQGTTTREFGESSGDLYAGGGAGQHNINDGRNTSASKLYGKGESTPGGGGYGAWQTSLGVNSIAENGTTNTGGGGGGGGVRTQTTTLAGTGGSGIVVIRNSR